MGQQVPESGYHELAEKRGFTYMAGYVGNSHANVGWTCSHGHSWQAQYSNIRFGSGCPSCAVQNAIIPESRYYKLAAERGFTYTGGYVGLTNKKVGWLCDKGHHWQARYSRVNQGTGCPHCIAMPEFGYHELAAKRGFVYTGGYVGVTKAKVVWRCKNGHNWQATYDNIRAGNGCPYCMVIPESAYYELAAERDFTYTGGYVGLTKSKVGWMCSQGHHWQARYNGIRAGNGCPRCNTSKGEEMISRTLARWGICNEAQRKFRACHDKRPLPFDFYIPKWKVLIEYHGVQHYQTVDNDFFGGQKELAELQRRDTIKRAFAEKYDYTLIEIPYTIENVSGYLLAELMKATGLSYAEISEPKQDGDRVSVRVLADGFGSKFLDYVQLPIF